jgi:hypothetical protein
MAAFGEEEAGLIQAQPTQIQPGHRPLSNQFGDEPMEVGAGRRRSEGSQQEDPGVGDPSNQMHLQEQCRLVGPMKVFQDDEKALAGRRGSQEVPDRLEQLESSLGSDGLLRSLPGQT